MEVGVWRVEGGCGNSERVAEFIHQPAQLNTCHKWSIYLVSTSSPLRNSTVLHVSFGPQWTRRSTCNYYALNYTHLKPSSRSFLTNTLTVHGLVDKTNGIIKLIKERWPTFRTKCKEGFLHCTPIPDQWLSLGGSCFLHVHIYKHTAQLSVNKQVVRGKQLSQWRKAVRK